MEKSKKSAPKAAPSSSDIPRNQLPFEVQEFKASSCTEANLQALVKDGVLPPKPIFNWSVLEALDIPWGFDDDRQVVFRSFFSRGFDLPCCSFFCGLLHFYGLELVNLNPNSILQISIFIHLCEAFLVIRPHFNLFYNLFHIRPLPSTNNRQVIEGVGIQN